MDLRPHNTAEADPTTKKLISIRVGSTPALKMPLPTTKAAAAPSRVTLQVRITVIALIV